MNTIDNPSNMQYTYLCKDGVWRHCNQAAITHMIVMADSKNSKFGFEYKKNW